MYNRLSDELVRELFTHRHFYGGGVNRLLGGDAKDFRQVLVTHMTGTKQPKAKCGFYTVLQMMFKAYNIPQGCLARMEDELNAALCAQIGKGV